MLIQKYVEFTIDLNAIDEWHDDKTAFHLACENGHSKVAEMIMQKSVEFNIDLNAKDRCARTAFHLACYNGHSKVAEMLIQKSV